MRRFIFGFSLLIIFIIALALGIAAKALHSTAFASWAVESAVTALTADEKVSVNFDSLTGNFLTGITLSNVHVAYDSLQGEAAQLSITIEPHNIINLHEAFVLFQTKEAQLDGQRFFAEGQYSFIKGLTFALKADAIRHQLSDIGSILFSLDAQLSGFAGLSGNADLKGSIEIKESILRPHFARLAQSSLKNDTTITLKNEKKPEETTAVFSSLIDKHLNIDLKIKTSKRLWIKHAQGELSFAGDVRLKKERKQKPQWKGKLLAKTGFFHFKSRRFSIVKGEIQLESLEAKHIFMSLTTSYDHDEYTIYMQLDGPISAIRYALYSEPDLKESEIFSLLLFNKAPGSISPAQQEELRSEVLSYAGSLLTSGLTSGITDFFGPSAFNFDFTSLEYENSAFAGSVGVGRHIGGSSHLFFYKAMDDETVDKILLDIGLAKRLRLKTSISTEQQGSLDIIWGREY